VERIITSEIERLARAGPTPAELGRAKNKLEYQFVTGLERIGGFGGKSDLLNQYNVFLGDPGKFEADVERHRRVTAAGIRQATERWLNTRNRLLVRFHPEVSGRAAERAQADRSQPPELGADRPFRAPEVKSAKLRNGLEVLVVERPELPKVAVSLVARAGAAADPAAKEGVANMVLRTIDKGTPSRAALEIEDALGDLGASLDRTTEREYGVISFEALKRNLAPALGILGDLARRPTFPQAEVEREKKRQLDDLSQEAKDPFATARKVTALLAFGREHPYGRPLRGRSSTVGWVTRGDLEQFHRRWWTPGNCALIIAGDVTLEEATRLAEQSLGGWSGAAPASLPIPVPRPAEPGKIYVVDRQDAAQTVITQLLPGIPRNSADYYPVRLADAVWGGGFTTRLNLNLREEKGYSYGIFSSASSLSKSGLWIARGGVQTDKTRESVVEFEKELENLAGKKPINEKELEDARANRVRGYAQQFETMGRITQQIARLWATGLPMAELQREADETAKVPLAAANAAAQRYAVPQRAALLLVGDWARIGPGIRELKLCEIVLLDSEGERTK